MGAPSKDSQTLSVTDNRTGKSYTIPIKDNSIPATAFSAIRAPAYKGQRDEDEPQRGIKIADPGYLNTAPVRSEITYIDGENGVLRYRGIPIEQLAEQSNHLETAYLLIYGNLPTKSQYAEWEREVMHHTWLHTDMETFISSFRYDAHPVAILTSAFAALGSFHAEANPALQGQKLYTRGDASLDVLDKQILRILGKAPTLAAMAYRRRQGRPFNHPPQGLSYTASFLYMMDMLSEKEYRPNPVFEKALDVLFLLHADHEMNASAAAVLQTGSTLVDPYSAVAAGSAALYGPLHGGANEAVIRMLTKIGTPDKVPEFLERVKRKEAVLSGFGHRVYRTHDPRSFIVRKTAEEVFKVTGPSPLLDTALALYDGASKDEYFTSRKLGANVDFWSGIIYLAMGFPMDFFTVLFIVPRCVGWLAHWRQMMLQQGGVKIWRPKQIYVGPAKRDYVPLGEREDASGGEARKRLSKIHHSLATKRQLMNGCAKAKL